MSAPALPDRLDTFAAGEAEVARVMNVCNACRYCEGYCAVFPAMERRLDFGRADVHYLANLCHQCGACLHACQYAPPHAFALNVPRAMAAARMNTYQRYAWPRALGMLYRHAGVKTALLCAAAIIGFLLAMALWHGTLLTPTVSGAGAFYLVFPHKGLVAVFGAVFAWSALAMLIGVARFWRGLPPTDEPAKDVDLASMARDALTLRYLDGGGDGCPEADDRPTRQRRIAHQLTMGGFVLCFAATCVATVYHYALDRIAPYAWDSLPVSLGIAGGIGLLIGPAWLWQLGEARAAMGQGGQRSRSRDARRGAPAAPGTRGEASNGTPSPDDPAQRDLDRGFLLLLFLVSASGLLLLVMRESHWMGLLLCAHLGLVAAFFVLMPYGKFAHAPYRMAALLKYAVEHRLPNRRGPGGE